MSNGRLTPNSGNSRSNFNLTVNFAQLDGSTTPVPVSNMFSPFYPLPNLFTPSPPNGNQSFNWLWQPNLSPSPPLPNFSSALVDATSSPVPVNISALPNNYGFSLEPVPSVSPPVNGGLFSPPIPLTNSNDAPAESGSTPITLLTSVPSNPRRKKSRKRKDAEHSARPSEQDSEPTREQTNHNDSMNNNDNDDDDDNNNGAHSRSGVSNSAPQLTKKERNKKSAQDYRRRRKTYIADLEEKVIQLSAENTQLKAQLAATQQSTSSSPVTGVAGYANYVSGGTSGLSSPIAFHQNRNKALKTEKSETPANRRPHSPQG